MAADDGVGPSSSGSKPDVISVIRIRYRGDGFTRTLSHGPAQSHVSGQCFLPCYAPRPTPTDKDALTAALRRYVYPTPGQHLPGRFARIVGHTPAKRCLGYLTGLSVRANLTSPRRNRTGPPATCFAGSNLTLLKLTGRDILNR